MEERGARGRDQTPVAKCCSLARAGHTRTTLRALRLGIQDFLVVLAEQRRRRIDAWAVMTNLNAASGTPNGPSTPLPPLPW
jgi:hypothetical protein